MGQKCSCLFNKKDEFFNFKKDEESDPNAELNYILKGLTKESNHKKSPLSTNSSTLEDKIKRFDSPKAIKSLIKLQALMRTFIATKRFKKSKKYLIDQRNKLITNMQKAFMPSNRAELTYQSTYDPNGYKKYYADKSDIFNVNYGLIMKTEILISNEEYYSGHVNVSGRKHGFGILYKKDGSKFEGFWQENEFTGWGRHIDVDGTLNEGIYRLK
jgi:hypothetical protein